MKTAVTFLSLVLLLSCAPPKIQQLRGGRLLIDQKGFDPQWDVRKSQLQKIMEGQNGMGILFALERESETRINFYHANEGNSVSKWGMVLGYTDPITDKEVILQEVHGYPGTGGSQFRLLMEPFETARDVQTIFITFAVGHAGQKNATAKIPPQGSGRKVYFLFVPEPN